MALDKTAQQAVQDIHDALTGIDLSDQHKQEILKIIQQSILETVEETSDMHREATAICCGPEADLAHKIAEEAERKKTALIANLSAMR